MVNIFVIRIISALSLWWFRRSLIFRVLGVIVCSAVLGYLVFGVLGDAIHDYLVVQKSEESMKLVFSLLGFFGFLLFFWWANILMSHHLDVNDASFRDALTKTYNRAYLQIIRRQFVDSARRTNWYIGAFFVDLDKFKQINDQYGHAAGDMALIELAKVLQGALWREGDMLFRFGGDEFLILICIPHAKAYEKVLDRFKDRLRYLKIEYQGQEIRYTASLGKSLLPAMTTNILNTVIEKADKDMYFNKHKPVS